MDLRLYLRPGMRHTQEEIRKMRNERKKKKRQQRSKEKKDKMVNDAIREVRTMAEQQKNLADQHRALSAKYYRLWRRTVDTYRHRNGNNVNVAKNHLHTREKVKLYYQ